MKALKIAAVLLSSSALGCGVAVSAAGGGDRSLPGGRVDLPLHRVQAKSAPPSAAPRTPATVPAPATPPPVVPTPVGQNVTADGIVVTSGGLTVRIKHIEIAGSSMSGADIVALFDTKNPKPLEERLHKLDASSIAIPEITGDSVVGGKTIHFTQKEILLSDVRQGRAATGIAAAASLSVEDAGKDTRISAGATTLEGLDLAQIVHLATGPRPDDGEKLQPLCDEIAIRTVSVGGPTEASRSVTISTIRATELEARPLGKGSLTGGEGDVPSLEDITRSFAAGSLEAGNIALAGPADASTRGLKSLALRRVTVHGFGDGRLSRFELSDLAMEGNDSQPGKLALGSAEIDNLALNATPVPSIDRIDLRDLSVDIPSEGTSADKDGGKADQHVALSVAHAGYFAPGLVIGKLPAKATLAIEHAAFDLPPDAAGAPALLAMGYKHLDLSGGTVSRYDSAAQTLNLDRLSLSGAGLCALDMKIGLAKVSDGIVSQDDAVQKAAAAAVVVKSIDVTLKNDGLVDKAIGFKAAIDGVSIEQERTAIVQSLDDGLVDLDLQGSAKARHIVDAVQKFINDPKTLHIALASKTGLGATSIPLIDSPQTLLDAVEVDASAD